MIEELKQTDTECVLDIELYPNYFLVMFYFPNSDKFVWFTPEQFDRDMIRAILANFTVYTFNGNKYDIPVLFTALLRKSTVKALFKLGGDLIFGEERPWRIYRDLGKESVDNIIIDHVDLIEVAFGKSSLKTYAGRIHAPYMQDLPYDPHTVLDDKQKEDVRVYCCNDCRNTWFLRQSLNGALELRVQLGQMYATDLRSLSDAQIAEAVISREMFWHHGMNCDVPSYDEDYSFYYDAPDYMKFETETMNNVFELIKSTEFRLNENGKVSMPASISKLKIKIGNTTYKLGIGGLHSTEKKQTLRESNRHIIVDRDVESYYPNIILNNRYAPEHLGSAFLDVYGGIVARRIAAKHSGDKVTANTLKITINGSFGKFGSPYSFLFAPKLLIQTTITGQLSLLMLIERLELAGFSVMSGNTDGIVTLIERDRKDEFDAIVSKWEFDTRFKTEETQYKALFSRDVNSYMAVKMNGSVKRKGAYAPSIDNDGVFSLAKNPAGQIIADAVEAYIANDTPIEDTVLACKDIRKFVFVRKVDGGCLDQNGEMIGKVVRWYQGKGEFGHFKYAERNAKVPSSDGAVALMYMTNDTFPDDIDYGWYISQAKQIVGKQFHQPVQLDFFD